MADKADAILAEETVGLLHGQVSVISNTDKSETSGDVSGENRYSDDVTVDEKKVDCEMPTDSFFLFIPTDWISSKGSLPVNGPVEIYFLLLNSMVGSGVLAQPYCFSNSGIALTIMLYFIIGYITWLGNDLIIISGEKSRIYDYAQLAEFYMGSWGTYVVDISILFGNYGGLVSYVITIGQLSSNVAEVVLPVNLYTSPGFLCGVIVTIFVTPTCMIRHYGHIEWAAKVTVFLVIASALFVCVMGPFQPTYFAKEPSVDRHLIWFSANNLFNTCGTITFAYSYTINLFPAYESLVPKVISVLQAVNFYTVVTGTIVCIIMGISGYLAFGSHTNANILTNFTGVHLYSFVNIFKMLIVVHLTLYIPNDFIVMRYY